MTKKYVLYRNLLIASGVALVILFIVLGVIFDEDSGDMSALEMVLGIITFVTLILVVVFAILFTRERRVARKIHVKTEIANTQLEIKERELEFEIKRKKALAEAQKVVREKLTINCNHCGSVVEEGQSFCGACGSRCKV